MLGDTEGLENQLDFIMRKAIEIPLKRWHNHNM